MKNNSSYERTTVFIKQTKNFSKIEIIYVDEQTSIKEILKKIKSNKTVVFCLILQNGKIINISENTILNLALNCDLNEKIGKLIKK